MCEQCEALRQEFAEDIIRRRLRLTEGEARLVCRMYRGGLYRPDPQNEDTVGVLINRIRKVMGRDQIETVRLLGYRLSDAGQQRVAQALEIAA
jgi:hypothetical protein